MKIDELKYVIVDNNRIFVVVYQAFVQPKYLSVLISLRNTEHETNPQTDLTLKTESEPSISPNSRSSPSDGSDSGPEAGAGGTEESA